MIILILAAKRLSDLIRRPFDLYRAGVFDEYFMGLMNQVAQAMDDSITQEVRNFFFVFKTILQNVYYNILCYTLRCPKKNELLCLCLFLGGYQKN